MCGILGIVTCRGKSPSVDDAAVLRMRDTMFRRGPDGAGLWRRENVVLAHRRLAVIAPGPEGAQPWRTGAGAALVYNGELYNDRELRSSLANRGMFASTQCDTETVALGLEAGGAAALRDFRGMYAIGFVDARRERLILARDPLGIKPLFWTELNGEIVFASDVRAILAHPGASPAPDMVTLSAYLTTIRVTLAERTLFAGVRTLLPGQCIEFDLTGEVPRPVRHDWWDGAGHVDDRSDVREAVEDSVRRHLRADVPTCCLLSGGLDSTVVATIAKGGAPGEEIWTYCAGAVDGDDKNDDFHFAREVARELGSRHTEAPISEGVFRDRWQWMVHETGMPLSTPNEVAINEVARRLRRDGKIVALSGEGADELFGGYEALMEEASRQFAAIAVSGNENWRARGGAIMLASSSWIPCGAKRGILSDRAVVASENDSFLSQYCREEFERLAYSSQEALQAALRFQRRVNLEGLLRRLDSATMLESVEGRTPFADQRVASLAESLPLRDKYCDEAAPPKGKIALRLAFAEKIPSSIVSRPKASFPLPFQEWGQGASEFLDSSAFARDIFTEAALGLLRHRPWNTQGLWRVGWPAVNLAIWGRRWWG